MKKFLLSFGLIIIFIAYSLHEKNEASNVHPIAPNTSPTSTQSTNANETPSSAASSTPPVQQTAGQYKDGAYTGSSEDAYYGQLQVKATIQNGKITAVDFLQYPNDRDTSRQINQQAIPYLQQEAIQAQKAQVDVVSGATDSSEAFTRSLQNALDQAKS